MPNKRRLRGVGHSHFFVLQHEDRIFFTLIFAWALTVYEESYEEYVHGTLYPGRKRFVGLTGTEMAGSPRKFPATINRMR